MKKIYCGAMPREAIWLADISEEWSAAANMDSRSPSFLKYEAGLGMRRMNAE